MAICFALWQLCPMPFLLLHLFSLLLLLLSSLLALRPRDTSHHILRESQWSIPAPDNIYVDIYIDIYIQILHTNVTYILYGARTSLC